METIQSSFTYSSLSITTRSSNQVPQSTVGSFDALLASFSSKSEHCTDCQHGHKYLDGDGIFSFINILFDQVQGKFDRASGGKTASVFPFSSEFESVFGVGGPLPSYINVITAELGLSAEKNRALQNIAINNKDATRSEESIQKISRELQAAGISR